MFEGLAPLASAFLSVFLVGASVGVSVVHAQDAPVRDYTIKKGDTCVGISIRELGDRKNYKLIHKHNKMGPLPHKLVPGELLRLPILGPTGPDANLSKRRGTVNVRKPATQQWNKGLAGMDLFRQWRINSQKRSTAEITFRDTSRLRMRENTIVVIYGPTAERTRKRTSRATLEKGTLRSRLAQLNDRAPKGSSDLGEPRLVIETPSSEAELGSGSALISVDGQKTARVSNHKGKAARLRARRKDGRRGKAVEVASGMGSKAEVDKPPTAPKPLPPTPNWNQGPEFFVGWAHLGGTLTGSWLAVAGAVEYRIEIARDEQGADVVANVTVPAQVNRFEAHGFPDGDYFVSVAARDADKFESVPSSVRKLKIATVGLTPLGSNSAMAAATLDADAAPDPSKAPPPLVALPGSVVTGGADVMCSQTEQANGQDPSASASASARLVLVSGSTPLRCTGAGVSEAAELAVEVPKLHSTVQGAIDGSIARDAVSEIVVAIQGETSSNIPLLEASSFDVTLSPGVELIERINAANELRLKVKPSPNPPSAVEVSVFFGIGGPLFVRHTINIEEPAPVAPVAPKTARRRWELGALFGGTLVDDEYELGNSPRPSGVVDDGGVVGLRAAHHFTASFALELEATYAEPGFVGNPAHANILGYRAHAIYHLMDGKLRPFVLGGFGGSRMTTNGPGPRDDADKEAYWGLGLRFRKSERVNLRLDLRHRVASGRIDRFSNLFEGTIGVGWFL